MLEEKGPDVRAFSLDASQLLCLVSFAIKKRMGVTPFGLFVSVWDYTAPQNRARHSVRGSPCSLYEV